jgi:hypothetical protein
MPITTEKELESYLLGDLKTMHQRIYDDIMTTHKAKHAEFIRRCLNKHGDAAYSYLNTFFIGVKNSITVTCLHHGDFEVIAKDHVTGRSLGKCPKCLTAATMSQVEKKFEQGFIKRAKAKHGDKYDYSQVVYVNSSTKVEILCKQHGVFECTPGNHLGRSSGCPTCRNIENGIRLKQFRSQHQDERRREKRIQMIDTHPQYDYSKTVIGPLSLKVIVTCKKHGDFEVVPNNFVKIQVPCKKCRDERRDLRRENAAKKTPPPPSPKLTPSRVVRFDDGRPRTIFVKTVL